MAFVLQPAVDVAPFQAEIDKTVEAFVTFLNRAISCDYFAAEEAFDRFCEGYHSLAPRLGSAGVTDPVHVDQAWWFNLSVVGFAKTGITARTIRSVLTKLGELEPEEVAKMLNTTYLSVSNRSVAERSACMLRVVENVVRQFWYFVSDTTLEGVKLQDGWTRSSVALDYYKGVDLDLASLHSNCPLPSMAFADEEEGVAALRSRIYWVALSLLS